MENNIMDLRKELLEKRSNIYTNQIQFSLGELMSMYKPNDEENEIILNPSYQRLYRWSKQQKSDLIESILLGYPMPPIFVMQTGDGVWEIIDGLQRLSTIFEFTGVLEGESNSLVLSKTRILKNLEGKVWQHKDADKCLDKATRIDFKRTLIPVIVLKYESEPKAKYELFRRLNTGGAALTAAEIRCALILMLEASVFERIEKICSNEKYHKLINIPLTKEEKKFDYEILTRFIAYRHMDITSIDYNANIDEVIDDKIEELLSNKVNINEDLDLFIKVINFLSEKVDEEYGFKRYDSGKAQYRGIFQWFIFETIVFGMTVINNFMDIEKESGKVIDIIKNIKSSNEYFGGKNKRVPERIKGAYKYASEVFFLE